MGLSINDLQPQPFTVKVKGVELTCQPLRLAHLFTVAKLGEIFQEPAKATPEQIKSAENEVDALFAELIPELKDVKLDLPSTLSLITQLMSHVEPDDNQELREMGVTFDADPKAKGDG